MEPMYYIGLDVHKRKISEGQQWQGFRRRIAPRHTF